MSTAVRQPDTQNKDASGNELNADLTAARSGSVLAPLTHLGILSFSGDDAEAFLQGQLSCDVSGVNSESSTWGAFCSPKGRMLASFLLWRGETGFLMALPRDILQDVRQRISRFVLRSKVKIADASDALALHGAAGPQAAAALRDIFPALPARPNEVRHEPARGAAMLLEDGRFVLAVPAERAAELRQQLAGPLKAVDWRTWHWLDIRSGIAWVTAATQDQFVPQMANLELIGGVSFEKGCYAGQEIVARTQHLGKLKRRMFLANVAAAAVAGDDLFSEDLGNQASGTIVDAEFSPDGGCDVLAVVQIASRENSTVHLKSLDGPALRFLPLPYAVS
jgi:folate-binding protein YgfZ